MDLDTEQQKFQGAWRQVRCEADGVVNPEDEFGRQPQVVFNGDQFTVTRANGERVIGGVFRLYPNRHPKGVDWIDSTGKDAGKCLPAIYEINERRLIFCVADAGQSRPISFAAGFGQVMRVFHRA